MKKLSNIDAELKKSLAYKRAFILLQSVCCITHLFSDKLQHFECKNGEKLNGPSKLNA